MKILSVEGKNLTSLEEFRVDFDKAPLAGHGIFAITGPTGAGKSTLLDAICLALYNDTPRLAEDTGIRVGREDDKDLLTSKDPRGLLRRGTAIGSAKVRFIGKDNHIYRAEWSVRRAHNKADGALQQSSSNLWDEQSGQLLSPGKQSETLKLITEKIGLSFDQFRRTVLLAQGDFAAFLKGAARDRAALLEKLTGQSVYSRISSLAFQRSKQARQDLESLEIEKKKLEEQQLDASASATLAQNLQDAEKAMESLEEELSRAQAAVLWYQQAQRLVDEENNARDAAGAAERRLADAQSLRAELHQVESVADCRVPMHDYEHANNLLQEATAKLSTATTVVKEARLQREEAQEQLLQQNNILHSAEELWKKREPELSQARILDSRLLEASRRRQDAENRLLSAQKELTDFQQQLLKLNQQRCDTETSLQQEKDWRATHELWEQRHQEWSLLSAQLLQLLDLQQQQRTIRARLPLAQTEAARLEALLKDNKTTEREAEELLQVLQQKSEAAEQARIPIPSPELSQALQRKKDLLKEMDLKFQRGEELKAQEEEERVRLLSIEKSAETAEKEAEAQLLLRPGLEARLLQSKRDRDASLEVRNLAARRAQLRPGTACALCGSTEHPWAHRPLEELVRDTEQELKELEKEQRQLEQRIASSQALSGQQRRQAEELSKRAEALAQQRNIVREDLRVLLGKFKASYPEMPPAPTLRERFHLTMQQADQEVQALHHQTSRAQSLQEAATRALQQTSDQSAKLIKIRVNIDTNRQAAEKATQHYLEAQRKDTELLEGQQALTLALPEDLRAAAVQDPQSLRQQLQEGVSAWVDHQQRLHTAESALSHLQTLLSERERITVTKQEAVLFHTTALQEEQQAEAALHTERALLLEGRPADVVERESRDALKRAIEARNQAADAANQTEARRAAADLAHRNAEADHLARSLSLKQSLDALLRALNGRKQEEVQSLLRRDQHWVQQARAQLRLLEESVLRATDLLQERSRILQNHQAEPPTLDQATATALQQDGATQRKSAQELVMSLQRQVALHAEVRRQLEDLEAPLGLAKAEYTRWGCVDDLIGSQDGAKFRSFAQGLTLELLIGLANENLKNFSDRYRLQRAPNTSTETRGDMNLQMVDRSMGEEVRPISTLSGGELFLVSLALALGLSSLASRQNTRVETVFIDEGFGSLDEKTLDVALSALEALQAEGRQVGIVSHVASLTARVGVQVRVKKTGSFSRIDTVGR